MLTDVKLKIHQFLFNADGYTTSRPALTHLAVDMEAFAGLPVQDTPRVPQLARVQKGDKLKRTLHPLQHDCQVILNVQPELAVWTASPLQNTKQKCTYTKSWKKGCVKPEGQNQTSCQ